MIAVNRNERWAEIPNFPDYQISTLGRVWDTRRDCEMLASSNNHGHIRVNLRIQNGRRYTRSVAQLVALAFVEPATPFSDKVVLLDGDLGNVTVENVVWRPAWYAWKYIHQFKSVQPAAYDNLRVRCVNTGIEYQTIIEAGIANGVLFDDIWRSTYTGVSIFPENLIFEVTGESI